MKPQASPMPVVAALPQMLSNLKQSRSTGIIHDYYAVSESPLDGLLKGYASQANQWSMAFAFSRNDYPFLGPKVDMGHIRSQTKIFIQPLVVAG